MRKLILEIVSALLILLFSYAALSKLLQYDSFKFQLHKSPFVTDMSGWIAWSLPVSELIISLMLLFKTTRMIGFYASFFLMLVFTGYIYAMLNFSPFVPCSCGGVLSRMSWEQHFYFNLLFTGISFAGIVLQAAGNNNKDGFHTLTSCAK